MKNIKVYIYIIILLSIFSCSTVKNSVLHEKKELPPINRKHLLSLVRDSSLNYSALMLKKVNIKINEHGKTSSYRGSIRILKDSSIWISLNFALGMEVVRLLITKDSVSFIDRYHKQYYKGSYAFLEEKLGIDLNYELIQSLLTNDLVNYEDILDDKISNKFNSIVSDGYYTLTSMSQKKLLRKRKQVERQLYKNKLFTTIYQTNLINPETFKVNKIYVTELYRDWKMNVSYSDYSRFNSKLIPTKLAFTFCSMNKEFSCTLSYSGIYFKDKLRIPFRIPAKYEEIVK
ncbi:MAG: DUF4292 domain-containing protein [Marinifilaceae bacterium]|jgi:hypothetical protein